MPPKSTLIKIGDFFFKFRNLLFPCTLIALFVTQSPVHEYMGSRTLLYVKDIVALLIVLSGLGLRAAVIGYKYIKRGGMNKKVYAEDLVTDGFFAVCRNPLYVGNFLIYAGVLLMHGAPLVILLGSLFFLFVYTAIVAAEEYFLREKFGAAFEAYCADVPRWRMKWSRLSAATQGMEFNTMRVIVKDYTTITNALIALLAIKLLEQMTYTQNTYAVALMGGIAFCVVAVIAIRVLKKRGVITA
ncbi:MAG: methyltransferase family protein [Rickettsiales bacterium]